MIDLRSDTVTRPTQAMRKVMAAADVGDDVWGDDPTVNALEEKAAALAGKAAAMFVPSGTQSNLIALITHCDRGHEYLVGQQAHTYRYEGGGAAVLGGIQPQPLPMEKDGSLDLAVVEAAIKPDDFHYAITRLLCLENTIGGKVLSLDYQQAACDLADRHGLRKHLDGARLFNAAVKLQVPVAALAAPFDTVSICLSKGLGAPIGSVLCGPADFIRAGRRWRKMLGGGMRQTGIVAAAGIHALDHHVERLAQDHEHARMLAEGLADIADIELDLAYVHTNMVFFTPQPGTTDSLAGFLRERGILVDAGAQIRLVTHIDISREDVLATLEAIRAFYRA